MCVGGYIYVLNKEFKYQVQLFAIIMIINILQ